jgi:hypothetical protein
MWMTRCAVLGTARRQAVLVVRPERLSEPRVFPCTTHPIQPLRLLDADHLDRPQQRHLARARALY